MIIDDLKKLFLTNITKENSDGTIEFKKSFLDKWIVNVKIPILGNIRCNILIANEIEKIFDEINNTDKSLINVSDTLKNGGCFFPRYMYCNIHKKWDKCKGLSLHALGLAIDINPSNNKYGTNGSKENYKLFKIFERYRWNWGGNWKIPDPMHYEKKF